MESTDVFVIEENQSKEFIPDPYYSWLIRKVYQSRTYRPMKQRINYTNIKRQKPRLRKGGSECRYSSYSSRHVEFFPR
jgi:hypothetical protein